MGETSSLNLFYLLIRLLWISWAVKPSTAWESGLREKYDGYGEDWIFMPDGRGRPQVAILRGEDPQDIRGVLEEPVGFILFTRYNKVTYSRITGSCLLRIIMIH